MWDTMGFKYFYTQEYQEKDYLTHTVFFGNMVSGAAFSFRKPKSRIILNDGYNEVIHDYQLALKYLSDKTLYFYNECLGIYRQHETQKIGAVITKVNQHSKAIRIYYEINNPILNLLHIVRRIKREQIFKYINKIEDNKLKSIVQNNIKLNLLAFLSSKMWANQTRLILKKLKYRYF